MRMPLLEFITGGDLKFMIALTLLFVLTLVQFSKKMKVNKGSVPDMLQINLLNKKIIQKGNWIALLSLFSLLLGLMHSFYFIGKVGGAAPAIIFQGLAFTLVTPVYGLVIYMLCKLMSMFFNGIQVVKSN
jgi:hypothetical protein